MSTEALQDRMQTKTCFGCGADNAHGLRIKSYWNGEVGLCTFQPQPHMTAGPPQYVNGGIIATLIDCHAICTAVAHWYDLEDRDFGSDPEIWCVTGSIHVDYERPTPIDKPVELRARVIGVDGKRATVECIVNSDGVRCAIGTVVAVRVDQSWMQHDGG